MTLLSRRELVAAAVAPLAAPVLYWIGLNAYGVLRVLRQGRAGVGLPSPGQLFETLGYVLIVGAPVAWATAVVALPVYVVVRGAGADAVSLGTDRRVVLLAVGAALGFVVARLMRPQLGGELFSIPFPPWSGALLGLAVAAVFLWMVARG